MKVTVSHIKSGIPKKYYSFYNKFIKFLQKKYPLNKDIKILFMSERTGNMTTGSRTDDHILKVLSMDRLNRDILRTLSHEWVHEYQTQILKREKGKNIGGRNEDEANASSGALIKQFEKGNPSDEQKMYNENEKTSRESRTNRQSNKRDRDKGK
jgi:hypothetical protein